MPYGNADFRITAVKPFHTKEEKERELERHESQDSQDTAPQAPITPITRLTRTITRPVVEIPARRFLIRPVVEILIRRFVRTNPVSALEAFLTRKEEDDFKLALDL